MITAKEVLENAKPEYKFIAMDEDGTWNLFCSRPIKFINEYGSYWIDDDPRPKCCVDMLNIEMVENWEHSRRGRDEYLA